MAEDRARSAADAGRGADRDTARTSGDRIDTADKAGAASKGDVDTKLRDPKSEDAVKSAADVARNEAKLVEDAAKDAAKAAENATKDAARTAEEAGKAAADAAKDQAKAAEDAAKAAADGAEEAAKDAADAAKDAAKAAEDAAKAEADAAEDQAKATEDAAGAATSDDSASVSLRDLGASESPEFDARGYPVRRGEVIAIDLSRSTRARAEAIGFRVVSEARLPALDTVVTRLAAPGGMSAPAALDALRSLDDTTQFDNAHYYGLLVGVAGDPSGQPAQMAPRKPGALRVGMIDTAVAPHAALRGISIEARDFSAGTGSAAVDHGTAVASILANEGTTRIVAAGIFKTGSGRPFTSPDAIVRALEWLVERDVGVINISLTGPRNAILDTVIARVVAHGHMIVAAAGNGGPAAPPAYPAAVPKVVAVTAIDTANRVYRYANQGDYIAVAAIGVAVPAAAPSDSIAAFSGTSFATPHVAAELARCLQKAGKKRGGQCVDTIEAAAHDLGAPGRDPVYGFGAID